MISQGAFVSVDGPGLQRRCMRVFTGLISTPACTKRGTVGEGGRGEGAQLEGLALVQIVSRHDCEANVTIIIPNPTHQADQTR